MFMSFRAWKSQDHLLNRMDIPALNRAYFSYPGVQIYLMLLAASLTAMAMLGEGAWGLAFAALVAVVGHPVIWYITHRFILHSKILMRFQATAALWKRTHYDHHQKPNDLSVLFGGLHTTVPPIVLIYGPAGYAVAGEGGAFAAIAAGIAMTMLYEYVHCIQHLGFMPTSRFLRHLKRAHLLHHYHDESGNYSITDFWVDRVLGSYYPDAAARPRSATARNLGYTEDMAERYPWVRDLSASASERPEQVSPPAAPTAAETSRAA